MQNIKHVLVIDDNLADVELLRKTLSGWPSPSPEFTSIPRLGDIFDLPASYKPDLIFLEIDLPDSKGLETFLTLDKKLSDIPVIILSRSQDAELVLNAIKSGAQEFLIKGEYDDNTLLRTIRYSIERKKNQQELKESEQLYRALVEHAPEALVVFDVESGKFVSVSESAIKLFKLPEHKLLELGPIDLSPAVQPNGRPSAELAQEKLAEALAGGKPVFEWLHVNSYGEPITCEVRLVRLPSEQKILIRGSVMDISERKKAEQAVRAVEETRKLIMNSALDAIVCMDVHGSIIFWTPQAEKIFGWKEYEVVGKTVAETIIPARYREQHSRGLQHYMKTGEGPVIRKLIEITALNRAGNEFPIELTIVPISQGDSNFFCAFIRDITERRKAEEEIRLSHENYESLVNNVDGIVWEADATTFNFTFVSKQAERLLGYPVENWLNDRNFWKDHIYEDDRNWAVEFCMHHTRLKKGHEFEYRMIAADGRIIWVRDIVSVVVENDKASKLRGIMVDITDRKKYSAEMLKMNDRLRHISKATNDAIWDHDLQTGEIWWNDKLYELYGMDPREKPASFEAWHERIHPDDRDRVLKKLYDTQRQQASSWQDEYRFRLPDGSYAHMFDRNYYIYKDGNLVRKSGSNLDISPLKKAEETLINNELRFRTLTSNAPVGIFQTDKDGKTIYVNETWMEITGMNFDAAMGDGWMEAVHPDDKERVIAGWTEKSGKAASSATDYRFINNRGDVHWVSGNAMPLYNKEGEFAGHIGTLTDITDRKNAEEALRESEEKYRTLVEQAGDAIAIFDIKGKIVDVNFGATQLLGYSKDELRNLTLVDVLSPEEMSTSPVRFDILESGAGTIRQRKMIRKDKTVVHTEVHAKRLTSGNFLALIRDLTERNKAQQEIERQKKLADTIIESLPGVFYLFDDRCRYIRWNKFKETISGYSAAEIINMSPLDFFEEDDKERARSKIAEGFAKGSIQLEANLVTKDRKKIPFYYTGVNIEYEGKPCLLGMGFDISDRKKAEDLLRLSSEQLRELSAHLQNIREEERISIAREIHDELGQQLTVLKMDISWLTRKVVSNDEKVKQKMNDLLEVIDGTVKTVRKISSDLRPSMLDDLGLVPSLEWHSQEFEKRSGIKTEFIHDPIDVELPIDTVTAMFRIFQESLTNVARHAEATRVDASLKFENEHLIMRIKDNGKGFLENGLKHKKTLGILGMQERVLLMKGEYRIESKPGKGTMVEVNIPLENNNR